MDKDDDEKMQEQVEAMLTEQNEDNSVSDSSSEGEEKANNSLAKGKLFTKPS
jgi:hypothetical protein